MTLLPCAVALSEFVDGYTGTCGQTALATCLAICANRSATPEDIVHLVQDMVKRGLASPNGAATIWELAREARLQGAATALEWDYNGMGDWQAVLRAHAGHQPVLMQVANGKALIDARDGAQDEADLHFHAIAVVGEDSGQYICVDGDNPNGAKRLCSYTPETLTAAQPSGLILFAYQPLPVGWTDDGSTLLSPPVAAMGDQRFPIIHGFRDAFYAHPDLFDALGLPLQAEEQVHDVGGDGIHGSGVRQIFTEGALGWTAKENVFRLWIGLQWYRMLHP